ncbi:MAG TPA: phosphomannomutase [Campylobacterales bacterium]|nr:phosphomannomutase [Campylobacterales bacterium]HHH50954.1 phosphomannomutase [Campylobacterales bacterium]
MKKLTIENKEFNLKDIKQLYPAVLVKTGYKDETTEMSLEWIDTEAKGRVEIAGYGLFVSIDKEDKYSFIYKTREELNRTILFISKQINS